MPENIKHQPIIKLVIPQYPEYVQITEGRRPVYYLTGDYSAIRPLPKKYQHVKYIWKKGRLWDAVEKKWLLKNTAFRHKPRYIKINGQGIWDGTISKWNRNKMRDALHAFYKPYIEKLPPIEVPPRYFLHIEYVFYFPFACREEHVWQDYFNHALPYQKTFEDALVEMGKLPSDSPMFVKGGYTRYVAVDMEGERRLEVLFYLRQFNDKI
jgi:hypothetical protein